MSNFAVEMKILIIEDEPGISRFLSDGLQEEGFSTIIAYDGAEGLKTFFTEHPDLVLLDWMLPSMEGIEVCREIRQENHETPILFLTAKDTVSETIRGRPQADTHPTAMARHFHRSSLTGHQLLAAGRWRANDA